MIAQRAGLFSCRKVGNTVFIYFRKVRREQPDGIQRWFHEAEKSAENGVEIDERVFSDSAHLFYVEKGDELYGVISYTIAQFAVVSYAAGIGEVVIIPSNDAEWDEAAKKEFHKMIVNGSLDETGYKKFVIGGACDSKDE